jgi:hypothetical protein
LELFGGSYYLSPLLNCIVTACVVWVKGVPSTLDPGPNFPVASRALGSDSLIPDCGSQGRDGPPFRKISRFKAAQHAIMIIPPKCR